VKFHEYPVLYSLTQINNYFFAGQPSHPEIHLSKFIRTPNILPKTPSCSSWATLLFSFNSIVFYSIFAEISLSYKYPHSLSVAVACIKALYFLVFLGFNNIKKT
jgi:hypothetical protein